MAHLFFCCEDNCDAAAHVSGGRCDGCFEAHVTYLRELHNPTRCDHCREPVDCSLDGDALFCGKSCEAEWLKEHDCNGFHYHEDVEAYTCDKCEAYYDSMRKKRDLALRFYLGNCYAEQPAGYEAAVAWRHGQIGRPPTAEQMRYLNKKLMEWDECEEDEYLYTTYTSKMKPEDLRIDIAECETMLDWSDTTDEKRQRLQERINRARRALAEKKPAGCVECGKNFDVGLLIDPTRCPQCIMNNTFPCQGRAIKKCCVDCGVERAETLPEIYCEWHCNPCWKARFG